jgi:hypothetical protein
VTDYDDDDDDDDYDDDDRKYNLNNAVFFRMGKLEICKFFCTSASSIPSKFREVLCYCKCYCVIVSVIFLL